MDHPIGTDCAESLGDAPAIALDRPARSEAPTCATLPWYDFPEVAWATAALWAALAERLRALGVRGAPDRLRPDDDHELAWRDPGLLLSQCCGYDAVLPWKDSLRVVATPCYRAPGCDGPSYTSLVVVREASPFHSLEDLRGARCAINNPSSHSGVNGLRALVAPLSRAGRFFASVSETGSHTRGLEWIQTGRVDVAAIDCVVLELLKRIRPERLRGIRAIARTAPAAAPPYVTRASVGRRELELLRQALADVVADPRVAPAREALLIERFELLGLEAYEPMVALRDGAHAAGYFEMDGDGASESGSPGSGIEP